MKNFRKFISSNKQNNLRLFFQISIVALVGIMGLFLWQPSAEMQDKNESEWRIQNIKGDISPNDAVPATRIPSITVSTNMGSGFGTNIQNTVNGVGLSSLSLTATHAPTDPANSWVSATGQLTGTVTFNLGGIFTVDSFSFWNQNGGGPGTNGSTGIQGVAVSTSTDGITFTPLSGGPTSFAQVTATANVPPQIFNFTPVSAGFFRFTILSNYGDTAQTGFAEVGFNAVTGTPTPTPTPVASPTPTPVASPTPTPVASPTPTPVATPTPQTCTPTTAVTEGDLFPGGIASFGVSSGPGSVTVDHVNAGTGLQSFTVVGAPTNAVVTIPPFAPGTFNPVTATFTVINPALPVDFTLRAASTFHAIFIRVRCVATCTPTTAVTEGDLAPGGIASFGVSSGPGSVTVDHVNAGTGLQSLTVVPGSVVNAIVTIPPFAPGTTAPVTVTFIPINPNLPVSFRLRAASTFHAVFIDVRCGTPVN